MEALNQEHVRINAVLPRLDGETRERAAQAHLALSPLARRMAAAEARYDADHDAEQLRAVAEVFDEMRASTRWPQLPADERSRHCTLAARCLHERYELSGDAELLHRAVAVAGDAVAAGEEAASEGGTEADGRTNVLALLPQEVTTDIRDQMAELVRLARSEAAQVLPSALTVQAAQLTARFDREGDRATIDQALGSTTRAFSLVEGAAVGIPSELNLNHGAALLLRFKRYGLPADVENAVTSMRDAVDGSTGQDLAKSLDGLGCTLIARSELADRDKDVDEAVKVLEQAVEQDPSSPWFRGDLAVALSARYTTAGRIEDARRAESLNQEVLAQLARSAPDRARIEQNLLAVRTLGAQGSTSRADGVVSRSETSNDPVLDARALLAKTPPGARTRADRLGGLAYRLLAVAEHQADLGALAEALGLFEEGLDVVPQGSPDRPTLLAGLGRGLRVRSCLLGSSADLTAALARAVEAAGSAAGTERAQSLHQVALTLSLRSARSGSVKDARATAVAFSDALDAAGSDIATTVDVSRDWAKWCAEEDDWAQAAHAAGLATVALDRLDGIQISRVDREIVMARAKGLAAQTSVAYVRNGDLPEALLTLERGRLRLLSEALSPPSLRDKKLLAATSIELEDVAALARELPLAYVAVDDAGAVVLALGRDGVIGSRFLPDVTVTDVTAIVAEFISAQLARSDDPQRWRATLLRTACWLGDTVWTAIRELLPADCDGNDEAQIGVIPQGLLGLLPLPAAARADPGTPGGLRYALDDCAITVVPSARLVSDRRRDSDRSRSSSDSSALVVDVAERAGLARLDHVEAEAGAVLDTVGKGLRLSGPKATRDAVLGAIPQHEFLHFACHGQADVLDPRGARLLLWADGEVSASDLLELDGVHARLAILSACQTAVYGLSLADEMIGLPTSLLQVGVAGVMGTLWEVNDVSAMLLIRRFVEEWTKHPDRPAVALRRAQLWIRDSDNEAEHRAFPDVEQLLPPSSPTLRAGWNAARPHSGPEHWASFSYEGW